MGETLAVAGIVSMVLVALGLFSWGALRLFSGSRKTSEPSLAEKYEKKNLAAKAQHKAG